MDKSEQARNIIKGIENGKQYSNLSPNVRNREEELEILRPKRTGKGGLQNTQAALSIVKRKMVRKHYDSQPEQAVQKELTEDAENALDQAGRGIQRLLYGRTRESNRPTDRTTADHNTENGQGSSKGAADKTRRVQSHKAAQQKMKRTAVMTAKNKAGKGVVSVTRKGIQAAGKSAAAVSKIALAPAAVIAVVILIVVIVIMALTDLSSSPAGIFFSNNADNPNQVSDIIREIENEWFSQMRDTRREYEEKGYIVEVNYGNSTGDMGGRVDNWRDVLAVYAVTHVSEGRGAVAFGEEDVIKLRDLFFEMNPVTVSAYTAQNTDGQTTAYADIGVTNMRWVQMEEKYNISEEQKETLVFLMSAENIPLWEQLGIGTVDTGVHGDISVIIAKLPPGTRGTSIVEYALSRLGDPYSMELRGQGNYIDCSGLTQWAYAQAGIGIPWTAAEQARYCVENNKVIDASQLLPGDLIFWSYPNSSRVKDRFMAIGHVAIYAGNGMMVEAAPSAGGVVYREVSVQGEPVLYARPHV